MKWITLIFLLCVGAPALAASCTADCAISCKQTVFKESPDEFTRQKCTDMGGTLDGGFGGLCVKYYNPKFSVTGYGSLRHEAMQDAKETCRSHLPDDCWSGWRHANTSNYQCD